MGTRIERCLRSQQGTVTRLRLRLPQTEPLTETPPPPSPGPPLLAPLPILRPPSPTQQHQRSSPQQHGKLHPTHPFGPCAPRNTAHFHTPAGASGDKKRQGQVKSLAAKDDSCGASREPFAPLSCHPLHAMLQTTTAYSVSTMTTGPSTTERPSTATVPSTPFDAHDSQSKLREILRDQSRREEQQSPSPATLQRHASHPTKASASSSSLANLVTSPGSDYFGTNSTSPSKRETALPHMGTSNLTDLYTASRTGLTSPQHRELARQPYADTLGAAPEIMPGGASSKLARSQSSAGLSNGLDLKVVILGAQGE